MALHGPQPAVMGWPTPSETIGKCGFNNFPEHLFAHVVPMDIYLSINEQQHAMNTVTKIKQAGVRKVHIVCIEHPEWGNWGVSEDNGEWLEIIGRSGSRVLHYAEANEHWRVA